MHSVFISYQRKEILSLLVFISFAVIAILTQQWQWVCIPFAWLIIPTFFQFVTKTTEQLFWLLLCLLPLSTELNITPRLGLDFPDEIVMILLTGVALLYWWHRPQQFPLAVWKHPVFFLLIMHVCWIGITTIYAVEPLPAIKFLLAKIWYIVPFVILPAIWLNSISRIQKLAACLLWPMGFVVVVTLFRHGVDAFSFESINRHLSPFFRNHVNYASFACWLFCFAYTSSPLKIPVSENG
jgi:hypothetical protein